MSNRSTPLEPAVPVRRAAFRLSPRPVGDTKVRLLDAAEALFIETGYDALSLRQITADAEANLAAVSYHFGSKDALIRAMLARRLDGLNDARLILLERLESSLGPDITCEQVLGAMFLPALQRARRPRDGSPALLRLIGRAYTDPSPFIRAFRCDHYTGVADRFFAAFQRALPHLPRAELGWRLHFFIGTVSRSLASPDTDQLIHDFSQGQPLDDSQLVGRLAWLLVSALQAPLPANDRACPFESILGDSRPSASTSDQAPEAALAAAPHHEAA